MQKKFVTNLALLLFLNLLVKPFWIFGIDRTVQNMMGAEVYGKYYALLNFSFLLNILLDAGITNYNNRNISQHQHLVSKHFSGIIVIRFLLAGVYFLFSLIAGYFIGYSMDDLHILLVLLANQFFISFILYLRSNLTGLHLFKSDSVVSVTDRFLMIAFCSFLIWGNQQMSIENFVYAQTLSYLITAGIALLFLKGKIKAYRINWKPSFYIAILKKSAPFALLILLMTFYSRIDVTMLERLLPDGAFYAGVYAQAYRILDAVNMFGFLFATLLLPMFSHMIKQKQDVSNLVRLSFSLIAIPAITLAIAAWFFKFPIMDLLYHAHAELSAPIFAMLMSSFFCMATTYIFGTLLTANGSLKYLNIMAASGMVLNVVLNLFFIPHYQALGASIASLITQLATAAFQVFLVYRIFHFKINYSLIFRLLLFVALLFLVGMGLHVYPLNWLYALLIFLSVSTAGAFLFRLVNVKEMISIIREK
jgi:O-antigen/teichoic acid export membrane protein